MRSRKYHEGLYLLARLGAARPYRASWGRGLGRHYRAGLDHVWGAAMRLVSWVDWRQWALPFRFCWSGRFYWFQVGPWILRLDV